MIRKILEKKGDMTNFSISTLGIELMLRQFLDDISTGAPREYKVVPVLSYGESGFNLPFNKLLFIKYGLEYDSAIIDNKDYNNMKEKVTKDAQKDIDNFNKDLKKIFSNFDAEVKSLFKKYSIETN